MVRRELGWLHYLQLEGSQFAHTACVTKRETAVPAQQRGVRLTVLLMQWGRAGLLVQLQVGFEGGPTRCVA